MIRVQLLLDALQQGQLFWFADWPIAAVPRSGALVYTENRLNDVRAKHGRDTSRRPLVRRGLARRDAGPSMMA